MPFKFCGSKNVVIEEKQDTQRSEEKDSKDIENQQTAKMANVSNPDWKKAKSVYEFNYVNIDGELESMEKYKGHVLVVVNVASF
jgi:hypothetical protein